MSCVFCPKRLEEYQRRLDISSLKQSEHPMILELKARTTSQSSHTELKHLNTITGHLYFVFTHNRPLTWCTADASWIYCLKKVM